jgi:ATP-dependent DNA helicase RecQ
MGIDKPDVRMVLHYDAPEHLEAYYQEAGRAGRDGLPSKALLLYNASDIDRLRDSVLLQFPPEAYLRQVYQSVNEYLQIPISAQPDRYFSFDLADFCKRFELEISPASYALRLLAQEGLWTISEAVFHPASIQFMTDRHNLDQVAETYPDLGYVTTGLLRLYGTIFHYPTTVRISALAYQLKLSKEVLEKLLQQLHNMEVLEYHKPTEGPQLYFHHLRVDSRHLIIDLQRISRLRRQHEARTSAMIAFLQNNTSCRENILKNYFGEETHEDCGHCDICLSKTRKSPGTRNLYKELPLKVKEVPGMTIPQLLKGYPASVHEEIVEVIRQLLDEGALKMKNNTLSVAH